MNKFKDFIYNTSDIIATLIIIAIAATLITWRVDKISDYGNTVPNNYKEPTKVEQPKSDDKQSSNSKTEQNNKNNLKSENKESQSDNSVHAVTIPKNATEADIAGILMESGLINDPETFYAAIRNTDSTGKLKYGNFNIPNGATEEEIIKILSA